MQSILYEKSRSLLLSYSGLKYRESRPHEFFSTYRNLLKPFSFPEYLMIENHEQSALRKEGSSYCSFRRAN